MNKEKQELLNMVDTLDWDNIELASRIALGLGLGKWLYNELKSIEAYLDSFYLYYITMFHYFAKMGNDFTTFLDDLNSIISNSKRIHRLASRLDIYLV